MCKSVLKHSSCQCTDYINTALSSGLTMGEATQLRTLGVSVCVTEVRYPVAALWELYKSAPLPKTMGKSCSGVQARSPVAWSPAALLGKPDASVHLVCNAQCAQSGGQKHSLTHANTYTGTGAGITLGSCLISDPRSDQRWWNLSSSAWYVDCTGFLQRVSISFYL